VDLLRRGEEPNLEFLDRRTDCADWAVRSVETLDEAFGVEREPLHLPRFACAAHGNHRGPQGTVNQRVLPIEELREQNVRMIGEFRQDGEDEVSLGMTPP
jgi:hypothetical protein